MVETQRYRHATWRAPPLGVICEVPLLRRDRVSRLHGEEAGMRIALALCLCIAVAPLSAVPLSDTDHRWIMTIADGLGVPRSVADRLQIEESGNPITGAWGDSEAISPPGADGSRSRGLYQISERWQSYLVGRYFPHAPELFAWDDPLDSAIVGLSYLAALHREYGTWERALWFYNRGSVVDVPQATREYARRVIEAREPK